MLMEYGWSYSDEEEEAVAELMRDCAVMIVSNFMPINSAGTGASSYKIPEAVVKYMEYDKSAYCTSRSAYSQPQWLDMLKNELSSGRPIVYSGMALTAPGMPLSLTDIQMTAILASTGAGEDRLTDISS